MEANSWNRSSGASRRHLQSRFGEELDSFVAVFFFLLDFSLWKSGFGVLVFYLNFLESPVPIEWVVKIFVCLFSNCGIISAFISSFRISSPDLNQEFMFLLSSIFQFGSQIGVSHSVKISTS